MADVEFGKCDICGKEAVLSRTYFKYRIGSCECCGSKLRDGSNGHFEVVHHCNKCVPHLPTVIHPLFKALDGKVYRANITNVLPFEIKGEYIIEEPVIVEDKQRAIISKLQKEVKREGLNGINNILVLALKELED